MLVATANIIIM